MNIKRYAWPVLAIFMVRCFPSETSLQGGKYAARLEECNRNARDLCESIACENDWRANAGRFPRAVPTHCKTIKDAGAE
jgi:hypothetical protein